MVVLPFDDSILSKGFASDCSFDQVQQTQSSVLWSFRGVSILLVGKDVLKLRQGYANHFFDVADSSKGLSRRRRRRRSGFTGFVRLVVVAIEGR